LTLDGKVFTGKMFFELAMSYNEKLNEFHPGRPSPRPAILNTLEEVFALQVRYIKEELCEQEFENAVRATE
jgi:hypothetical protein